MSRVGVTPGIRIEHVVVGTRARRDLGDLTELTASIERVGLLEPIVLDRDNVLIAGRRRLECCRNLAWEAIPYTVAENITEAVDYLIAERDENTCRKPMTKEELIRLGMRIEELERPAAKQRQGTRTDLGRELPRTGARKSQSCAKGRVTEQVADALGIGPRTYEMGRKVVTVAEDPNQPEHVRVTAQQALEEMGTATGFRPAYDKVMAAIHDHTTESTPTGATSTLPDDGLRMRTSANRAKTDAAGQRSVITRLGHLISGAAIAIERITELDPEITAEEASLWAADLSGLHHINRLHRLIKERTKNAYAEK